MEFLYPSFLYALSLLAIPIIIHLFNFRRYKKVLFSNVRFLREVKEETVSRSRLKNFLVLLARLLALAFLVFAFAQPYIPNQDQEVKQGAKAVSVFVDNSFSMNAAGQNQSLLQSAKRKGEEVVNAYGQGDRYQLLTNDFEGKHQRLVNREQWENLLWQVEETPAVKNLSTIQARQKQALNRSDASQKVSYIMSDFQKSIVDDLPDTSLQTYLIPFPAENQQNIYIDSCWFTSPVLIKEQANKLQVRIRNTGDTRVEDSRLTIKINGEVKAINNYSIEAGGYTVDTLNFTMNQPGWYKGEVSINDHPITFDNSYFLSFKVEANNNVLVINEGKSNRFLNTLYRNDDFFILDNQRVNQLDYASLNQYDIIILNSLQSIPSGLASALREYMEDGGTIAMYPNMNAEKESYNNFLTSVNATQLGSIEERNQMLSSINMKQGIFKDVFEEIPDNIALPNVKSRFRFSGGTRTTKETILSFQDESAFLNGFNYKNGDLFLFASPLDLEYTDLPSHALFVPMMYKMALNSQKVGKLSYTLGSNEMVEVQNRLTSSESVYRLKSGDKEMIPPQKARGAKVMLDLDKQIDKAGIYELTLPEADYSRLVALNYDRRESDLSALSANELDDRFQGENIGVISSVNQNLSDVVEGLNRGVVLWKLCIIFVLVFIGAEILLLRLWP